METFGRYELVSKLAEGGMAEIHLARQKGVEGFTKQVVLKRIHPHLAGADGFVSMFLDEARLAARRNHPNVVQILDLGEHEGTYFIAMELIDGLDVAKMMKRSLAQGTPLPIELCCRIIADAARGLDAAHRATADDGTPLRLVHRDISPQNLLVSKEGVVKITDFGIAKAATQARATLPGTIRGKVTSMSPEQAMGEPLDGRSDLFSLGVVLYELLTRKRLFRRETDAEALEAIVLEATPPPSTVNPGVPAALDRIVLQALEKKPADRFRTGDDFSAALEGFLLDTRGAATTMHLKAFVAALEGTTGERPPLPLPSAPAAPRAPESSGPTPTMVAIAGAAFVVLMGLGAAYALHQDVGPAPIPPAVPLAVPKLAAPVEAKTPLPKPPTFATLRVVTEPAGATVDLGGLRLDCVTPCTLPPTPAGARHLVLSLEGYTAFDTTIDIPESGEGTIPFVLSRAGKRNGKR